MYQFFVEDEQVAFDADQKTGKICITGTDVNHIRNVLRMKTGEKVRVSDRSGHAFFCCLEGQQKRNLCLQKTMKRGWR